MDPVSVGGYVAAALAAFLAWYSKRGVAWRDEAEAQKARADRLEGEMAELRSDFQEYRTRTDDRVNRLESEKRLLGELGVIELGEKMEAYHADVLQALARI